jgi:hypothetical protein
MLFKADLDLLHKDRLLGLRRLREVQSARRRRIFAMRDWFRANGLAWGDFETDYDREYLFKRGVISHPREVIWNIP